jgi:hypothetical protein
VTSTVAALIIVLVTGGLIAITIGLSGDYSRIRARRTG